MNNGEQFIYNSLLFTIKSFPIPNYQFPIPNSQFPITNYQLPITNYQSPITNYQIKIIYENSFPKKIPL